MDTGVSPRLTFDLDGRRSNRAGGGFKRFSLARASPVRFSGDFLGDVCGGLAGRGRSVVLNDWFGGHSEGRPR
jgi:hypothetical protein